jgi:hypothetical protein
VDEQPPALKCTAPAFDSDRAMHMHDLKARIQRADYVIDPAMVAVAMIRHAISQRRWWNPCASWRTAPALSTTSGGPSPTVPIQVSGAPGTSIARSTQTHNS